MVHAYSLRYLGLKKEKEEEEERGREKKGNQSILKGMIG